MLLDADDSQLVLVDYQARLMPVIFENEIVIANAVPKRVGSLAYTALRDCPRSAAIGQNLPVSPAICRNECPPQIASPRVNVFGHALRLSTQRAQP